MISRKTFIGFNCRFLTGLLLTLLLASAPEFLSAATDDATESIDLRSNEESIALSDKLLNEAREANRRDEKLTISFLHSTSNGNELNPFLKYSFEILARRLEEEQLVHRVEFI